MQNVNYELLGSMPRLDVFANRLPAMIAQFEAGKADAMQARAVLTQLFKTGGPTAVAKYCQARMDDPKVAERVAMGVTIELCAQHFYGIDTVAMNSIDETIAQMKAMDSELEHGK